jgi:hypothetical protein
MRRKTIVLGLTLSAVALVALVYSIASHRSPSNVEPTHARQTSSINTEVNKSTAVVVPPLGDDQNLTVTKPLLDTGSGLPSNYDDEDTTRKEVREDSTQDIRNWYSLLLEHLDLTPSEKEALIAFLIEDLIAKTRTPYASGIGMDEQERSNRIAAIIGDSKLQQFLALARNLSSYRDVARVGLVFQEKGAPLTDAQQDGMLKIFVEVRDQLEWMPPADVERRSIEGLEHRLTQEDDFDRLVLELAPVVLSPKQVQYLFERYQALSYWRAASLERQRKARTDNPTEDLPLGYPSRSNLNIPQ